MNGAEPVSPEQGGDRSFPAKFAVAPGMSDETKPVPTPVETLTPEEQMALFEKELKENDWGHQPC